MFLNVSAKQKKNNKKKKPATAAVSSQVFTNIKKEESFDPKISDGRPVKRRICMIKKSKVNYTILFFTYRSESWPFYLR